MPRRRCTAATFQWGPILTALRTCFTSKKKEQILTELRGRSAKNVSWRDEKGGWGGEKIKNAQERRRPPATVLENESAGSRRVL